MLAGCIFYKHLLRDVEEEGREIDERDGGTKVRTGREREREIRW